MIARLLGRTFLLLLALLLPVIVSAQVTTTGRLTGVVTDSTGALVPEPRSSHSKRNQSSVQRNR